LPQKELALSQQNVSIATDIFKLKIDPFGGDIVYLELVKYPVELKQPDSGGYVLLDQSQDRYYVAQSGLLSDVGPDSRTAGRVLYETSASKFSMNSEKDKLNVDLLHTTSSGVKVTKRFMFSRGSHIIEVKYLIDNQSDSTYEGSLFGRLKRNLIEESGSAFGVMRTYTGAAVNTPDVRYKKLPFDEMEKKPFRAHVGGGWLAMVEHYFTSAWVPAEEGKHYYQSEIFQDNTYGVRFISTPVSVAPGTNKEVSAKLYCGPEIAEDLKSLSAGLELTVDYGVLWWICQPIFWLLKEIFSLVGNWGWAIILTTVVIKLLFYKLSAASYRSMGNMRRLQPRIETLKQRFGEDKQKFGQAVMDLYRREKINPLGGCLPILVQIPVFIALYYVLLESVELRQASFAFWLTDLSLKDPFYVLPLLMGASMVIQQRMNPAPPDPIQAKVMMAMPIVFTFLFLQFPSGLVLYWLVNNVLSILQQWMITRRIDLESKAVALKKQ
jgi:YidC/Oxa1 family membrane protein insertase